ncbi:hypothetical protein KKI23_01355, partial [Patescibacteria group bacterium]|nr:hypothetical protein [Patescibacteria group bacterium]
MKNRALYVSLAVLYILAFINFARYLEKQTIDSGGSSSGTVLAYEIDMSDGRLRDNQRLKDITLIQYGLNLFYESYGLYPSNLSELSDFIDPIPQDPKDQWINYTYVPIADRTSHYVISYGLEEGYAGIDFGEHRATQSGMSAGDIVWANVDTDSDGLDDNLETEVYLSDPH